MKTEIPFTLDDIQELAGSKVFMKGEDYYESGAVNKIIRKGDVFEGTVEGSQKYKVRLEISGDRPEFRCSCPFEYGLLCKHEVAFAIAVLEGDYHQGKELPEIKVKYAPEEFDSLFARSENPDKIEFLRQLLLRDSALQSQFIAYIETNTGNQKKNSGIEIDEIKDDIYEQLSTLEFDHFVEEYDPYDGDYYDDDGYLDDAYESIGIVYEDYTKKAIGFMRTGNIRESFMIICGMIEGSHNLPEPADNYDIFDSGFNYAVTEKLHEILGSIASEFEKSILSDENIFSAIRLLFDRFSLYKPESDDKDYFYFKAMEKPLIALIKSENIAGFLSGQLDSGGVDPASVVYVRLKIAEVLSNEEMWIKSAEEFAPHDQKICLQLLEKYKSEPSKINFRRVAKPAFDAWPFEMDKYLVDHLDKNGDDLLYVNALKHYTRRQQSVTHFKELRNYLSDTAKEEFISQAKSSHNEVFYVKMLEAEGRFSDIRTYVRDHYLLSWSFSEIIVPILNVYPDDCLDMIIKKCNQALTSPKRKRDTYLQMVSWLRLMKKIVSKQIETQKYIESLYHHKPNLPALKDELKKAGWV